MPLSTSQYGFIIDPMVPFTDASGTTIRNGYVRVFVAGSSTPVITYKNYDGATNEETIQLDNSGRTAYPVIVSKGNTYKVCVYDAEHSQESPILTIDKVVPAGANVEATNIVTGLDNVESPEAGWVKSTVSGTDAEVSLDATNVTSEVDTMVKATSASADYMMPLVHKTGSDPDKKITLGNIFKFVLNFIHSLTDTATEADLTSGNYFALDGSAGTKKLPGNCVAKASDLTAVIESVRENNTAYSESYKSSMTPDKGIVTNGGVGSVVSYTEISQGSCSCLVLDCSKGDIFKIKGHGYSAYRLWCFVDTSDKIVEVASSGVSTNEEFIYIESPANGKIIVNFDTAYSYDFFKNVSVEKANNDRKLQIKDLTESVLLKSSIYGESLNGQMVFGSYIATGGIVGSVVDYTPVSLGGAYHIIVSCNKGDSFKIRGIGGIAPRLWCFVDSSDKIIEASKASLNSSSEYIGLVAPADGKLICNYVSNTGRDFRIRLELDYRFDLADEKISEVSLSLNKMSSAYSDYKSQMNAHSYINTSGGIGSVVDYTLVSSGGWYCIVIPCVKGDVFKLTGNSGNTPRLWCFVDSSDKIVEVAPANASATSFIYKIAPVDGKFIYNCTGNTYRNLYKREELNSVLNNLRSDVDEINNRQNIVNLEIEHEKFDPTDLLDGFIFTDHENYVQSIYSLFDALVSSSNGLITSFDLAEYADETYPAYVGEKKLKCYKVSINEAKWGNEGHFVKKKILIIGGTHGNEKAAPFNCFIWAWRLLNDSIHSDIFALLDAFDFYIVPCLNIYGLTNNSRYNGNGVDLNRNSDYPGWQVSGTPFNDSYTGPSADSEYETRCIHSLVEGESIDFLVDHHNYASASQFYTETRNKPIFLKTYDALKEISLFCIKNWPEYFGSKFQLVKPTSYGSASPQGLSATPGTFEQWADLRNIFSLTLEINQCIAFDDGVPDESYSGRDAFGSTTFSVGEFTLRCQLALYGQLLMPQVY